MSQLFGNVLFGNVRRVYEHVTIVGCIRGVYEYEHVAIASKCPSHVRTCGHLLDIFVTCTIMFVVI